MALALQDFSITSVGDPKLGESRPSQVPRSRQNFPAKILTRSGPRRSLLELPTHQTSTETRVGGHQSPRRCLSRHRKSSCLPRRTRRYKLTHQRPDRYPVRPRRHRTAGESRENSRKTECARCTTKRTTSSERWTNLHLAPATRGSSDYNSTRRSTSRI